MTRVYDDIIVKTIARILTPFIQIFALYVIMHGHHSPGGGFQGGVIFGASLILLFITHGLKETKKRIAEKGLAILSSLGVLIYSGIGFLCIILLGNYLDYGKLSKLLHVAPAEARSLGILGVEIGVGLTVMAVMVSIFLNISTGGTLLEDEEDNTR
jgi:multicomponent Na+:H+ antiporter subunit B